MNKNEGTPAIRISGLTKVYRLYDKPSDRLKEALGFGGKKRYHELYALKNVSFEHWLDFVALILASFEISNLLIYNNLKTKTSL